MTRTRRMQAASLCAWLAVSVPASAQPPDFPNVLGVFRAREVVMDSQGLRSIRQHGQDGSFYTVTRNQQGTWSLTSLSPSGEGWHLITDARGRLIASTRLQGGYDPSTRSLIDPVPVEVTRADQHAAAIRIVASTQLTDVTAELAAAVVASARTLPR
ncbi:MAG: hypothetical protein HY078_13355 [Elusimicrobia bacterium]|nr:hypothetical protein [Elusimicrobiota bacterium]